MEKVNLPILKKKAKKIAEQLGVELYLVGGVVRDWLLKGGEEEFKDVDLVVSSSRKHFAILLAEELNIPLEDMEFWDEYFVVKIGKLIDVASFRREYYPEPSVLPKVSEAETIVDDLKRRDFTINAMAYRLWPEPEELIDPFGGREDLKKRLIRFLKRDSFVEDPTRIYRAVRYKERFEFEFEEETFNRILLDKNYISRLTPARIRSEFERIADEDKLINCLEFIYEYNLVPNEVVHFLKKPNRDLIENFLRSRKEFNNEAFLITILSMILDSRLDQDDIELLAKRFAFTKKEMRVLEEIEVLKELALIDNLKEAYKLYIILSPMGKKISRLFTDMVEVIEERVEQVKLSGNDIINIAAKKGVRLLGKEVGVLKKRLIAEVVSSENGLSEMKQRELVEKWVSCKN